MNLGGKTFGYSISKTIQMKVRQKKEIQQYLILNLQIQLTNGDKIPTENLTLLSTAFK